MSGSGCPSPRGGSYNRTQQVAFSCSDGVGTGCAATHYTTDGSTPTRSSPSLPSGQTLPISSNTVLKFFSVDAAENAEAVKTESYLIDTQPPTTTASPRGRSCGGALDVALTCVDTGGSECAGTWYTLDGSAPSEASLVYTVDSPVRVSATATLRFFSKDRVGNREGTPSP